MSQAVVAPFPYPVPGPHGGDVERVARALGVDPGSLLDLSASLNPVAPDVSSICALRLDSLGRYPDPSAGRALLAETIGVEAERLLLTNGGSEAISLLSEEIGGQVAEPEFGLHPRGGGADPWWRSNPHNPSGRLAGPDERVSVWDEAFYPLATGTWTRGDRDAVAVVGSLTKLFACPGLRIGYVVADPELIDRLARRQPHWSVSSLALAVLPDLLEGADLPGWAASVARLREDLRAVLSGCGLMPEPSDANFVLCPVPDGFRAGLLAQGIAVRDCTSFGMADHVRIAVPGEQGLERLSDALGKVVS